MINIAAGLGCCTCVAEYRRCALVAAKRVMGRDFAVSGEPTPVPFRNLSATGHRAWSDHRA